MSKAHLILICLDNVVLNNNYQYYCCLLYMDYPNSTLERIMYLRDV